MLREETGRENRVSAKASATRPVVSAGELLDLWVNTSHGPGGPLVPRPEGGLLRFDPVLSLCQNETALAQPGEQALP